MKPNAVTSCTSKKKYETKVEADLTAAYIWQKRQVDVCSYKCPICEGWHLTSNRRFK